MFDNNLAALQVIIPLIGAPLCLLFLSKRAAWLIAFGVCCLSFIISILLFIKVREFGVLHYSMGNWKPPIGISYLIDSLNVYFLLLVSFIGSVTLLYAKNSIDSEIEDKKQPFFYTAFILCFAGFLGIISTNDVFNIYVLIEIASISSYGIIAMGKTRQALMAAFEYLILGTIGATLILIAIGILYMMTGTLNISDLAARVVLVENRTPVVLAMVLFVVGLLLKIAMFPLHIWLTNAYNYAPSFVTTFLAATGTKVSIYVLIRVLYIIFGHDFSFYILPLGSVLKIFALLAIIIASFVALKQMDVRRMLAYSSVAQVGYIMLALSISTKAGMVATLLFIFNHAIAKSALFLSVGCVTLRKGSANLSDFGGISRQMPITFFGFMLAGLSLVGVPLFAGFVSKFYLITALLESRDYISVFVVLLGSFIAALYIFKVIEYSWVAKGEAPNSDEVVKEAPFLMLSALVIMVGANILIGVYATPLVEFVNRITENLFVGI